MSLLKAKLINVDPELINKDDGDHHIQFMFNPTMISFSRSMNIEQSKGSRSSGGNNKTSFKHPNPYTVQIANVILDTYESRKSVLDEIKKFKKGVQFVNPSDGSGKQGKDQRPPIYLLTWGKTSYLKCFIKTLNFKLTLFLSDGTPVRATVDLALEQVDIPNPQPKQGASNPSLAMRKQGRANISEEEKDELEGIFR
jgi:Contractile injection system tube protein